MDSIIPSIISGTVIAALGGLAWVSYHKPKSYRRLFEALAYVFVIISAFCVGHNVGMSRSIETLKAFKDRPSEVIAVLEVSLSNVDSISYYMVGVQVVLVFFLTLPLWLRKDED